MLKRYSVRNLSIDAIEMLSEIKAEERREFGAILEDCIQYYWQECFEDFGSDSLENAAET